MAAGWNKNETVAAKRRCDLVIVGENGQLAPPGIDLIAAGCVFISGVTQPKYALATGTLTNKRRPLDVADFTFTADHPTETFTAVAHTMETGDGPVRLTNAGGALPAGLALATDYWIIRLTADTFKLAASLALAYAGTEVLITGNGTGVHTVDVTASTERGLWGEFTYEATQAETNHDGTETVVIVDGTVANIIVDEVNIGTVGFRRRLFCGAYTTVMMVNRAKGFDDVSENGRTYGQQFRIAYRTLAAKFSKVGQDYTYRDDADTKDSHTGTVTAAGRTARNIIDAD